MILKNPLELSTFQSVILPFFLVFFGVISIFGARVPRLVLLSALICGVSAISYNYLHVADSGRSYLVAHLRDDPYESVSRLFREDLNREGDKEPWSAEAKRYHGSFASQEEVEEFFSRTEELSAIVWGTSRWVNLSFREGRQFTISPERIAPWVKAAGMKLVSYVPVTGLSLEPRIETSKFISQLIGISLESSGEISPAEREAELVHLMEFQAAWNSFAHRAYPAWRLGNLYLEKALSGGDYDGGELRCALAAYTRGRNFIKGSDNPELLAALMNNRAVAHKVLLLAEGKAGRVKDYPQRGHSISKAALKKLVRRDLKVAVEAAREKNLFGVRLRSSKIAKGNLRALKEKKARIAKNPRAAGVAGKKQSVGKGKKGKKLSHGKRKNNAHGKRARNPGPA